MSAEPARQGNPDIARFRANLSVKNWSRFQHYKKRSPPWIKLYTTILDDPKFAELPDAAKGQLMMLWALAARRGNRIPFKPAYLRDALNVTGRLYINELLAGGWLYIASEDASNGASMNASKTASAGASSLRAPEKETSSSLPETRFLAALSPDQRTHWSAVIDGWREGMSYPGGRCADEDDIRVGLTEYLADNPQPTFNPQHVVAYVRKAETRRRENARPTNGPYFSPEEVKAAYE